MSVICKLNTLYHVSCNTICTECTIWADFESNYSSYKSSDVIDAHARLHLNGSSCNFSW